MKLTQEELERLIEPEPYDDWHERTCATSDGPPGPFPCDCKTSEGWRVFLLPPSLSKEEMMRWMTQNGFRLRPAMTIAENYRLAQEWLNGKD